MKAELNAHGCLIITAESPVESYALDCWFDGYRDIQETRLKPTLKIETPVRDQEA